MISRKLLTCVPLITTLINVYSKKTLQQTPGFIQFHARPGDSYWVLYCVYNTYKYWVYPILTIGIVIFPIQYNITIVFFSEKSGPLRKVKYTGEK